jgi:hypothetical protein
VPLTAPVPLIEKVSLLVMIPGALVVKYTAAVTGAAMIASSSTRITTPRLPRFTQFPTIIGLESLIFGLLNAFYNP